MTDSPYLLDKFDDATHYVYNDSYITKYYDKLGYEHVPLRESLQTYVGLQRGVWWLSVCTTLPFGWKETLFIYHSISLAASGYLRSCGVPCSFYMDDRLNGKVFTSSGPLSAPLSVRFFSRPGTCFRGVVFACAVGVSYRQC